MSTRLYLSVQGLNTDIIVHHLPLKPYRPVKQKLTCMKPEWTMKIKEDVVKHLDVGFHEIMNYPEWLANIVPVLEKDGKVRMCVDYQDLNRASLKDDFPLPQMDVFVDNIVRHALFSLMDGFSSIIKWIAPKDQAKTFFVTLWWTFCYKVMPFGLTNAGAIYQRVMTVLFHDMMHNEMEVYVDDMTAKSKAEEEHLADLQKIFEWLQKCDLNLNLTKYVFGVTSGKFLGVNIS